MTAHMVACMDCWSCGYRWVAVMPSPSVANPECPNCHKMTAHQNQERTERELARLNGEQPEPWRCPECGAKHSGRTVYLRNFTGNMCLNCGGTESDVEV